MNLGQHRIRLPVQSKVAGHRPPALPDFLNRGGLEADLRKCGALEHLVLHVFLNRGLVLFGEDLHFRRFHPKPNSTSARIIHGTLGDGCADFVFVARRRKQAGLPDMNCDPAPSRIERLIFGKKDSGNQQR